MQLQTFGFLSHHTCHFSCPRKKGTQAPRDAVGDARETQIDPGRWSNERCGVTVWIEEGHPGGTYVVMLCGVHVPRPWRQMTSRMVSPCFSTHLENGKPHEMA